MNAYQQTNRQGSAQGGYDRPQAPNLAALIRDNGFKHEKTLAVVDDFAAAEFNVGREGQKIRNQLRKLYNQVRAAEAKIGNDEQALKFQVRLLQAQFKYNVSRKAVNAFKPDFVKAFEASTARIRTVEDYRDFVDFFEVLYAYGYSASAGK